MTRFVLVPGRHHVFTAAQARRLAAFAGSRIVFAVTSANRAHSRYNPVPFFVRAIGADRLARGAGLEHHIVGIPHYPPTDRFARNTIQDIAEQTEGEIMLAPNNCRVACTTAEVAAQYRALGFEVVDVEGDGPAPVELMARVGAAGVAWSDDEWIREAISNASHSVLEDFPEIARRTGRLYSDPLLDDAGSLTETRDYAVYQTAMSNAAVIQMKYDDVKPHIADGKIVDEGCGDGALLVPISRDFPDADLIGLEISGEFMAQCLERQRRGDYRGTYVHFHQRNLLERVFVPRSIDTTLCNSTLHELWSYGGGEDAVRRYLAFKYEQTRPGGRLVIRDVVGPPDKARRVALWCDADELAKLERFERDFLPTKIAIDWSSRADGIAKLSLHDAVEFLTKKDYVANWASEMHETFCFWDVEQWAAALRDAGFVVRAAETYTNPWIVEHRWAGRVELRDADSGEVLAWPPTTMVLCGERG